MAADPILSFVRLRSVLWLENIPNSPSSLGLVTPGVVGVKTRWARLRSYHWFTLGRFIVIQGARKRESEAWKYLTVFLFSCLTAQLQSVYLAAHIAVFSCLLVPLSVQLLHTITTALSHCPHGNPDLQQGTQKYVLVSTLSYKYLQLAHKICLHWSPADSGFTVPWKSLLIA